MTKITEQQIADLYTAAVSAEVNDEAGDAASASSYELFDQLDANGGMAHTIRVLIDRVRAAERAMNPQTAADDIAWWKQEAEDCKRLLLERVKENDDLRRSLAQYESAPAPDSRHSAAVATLESSGYTYHGGQFWKPPIGKAPAYITGAQPKSELLQRAEKLAEECGALAQRVQGEDLRAKVRTDHAEWATATFGNTGPVGPLKHLSKEALEAAEAPQDLHEWADMQFLFWDAQRKAGVTDEQITEAMVEKLEINKARQWPEPKDGEPRFHIKGQ